MVVNFRARGISRGARKLARTPTLNEKKYPYPPRLVAQRQRQGFIASVTWVRASACTSVTPAVSYLSTGLAMCSVDPEISCGARKLTRTPRITKKIYIYIYIYPYQTKCLAAKGRVLLSSKWNVTLTSANNEVLCAICSKFNLFHANEVKSHHKHSRNLYAGFWMVCVLLIYSNKTSQELLLILQNLQRYFQSSLVWDFSPKA